MIILDQSSEERWSKDTDKSCCIYCTKEIETTSHIMKQQPVNVQHSLWTEIKLLIGFMMIMMIGDLLFRLDVPLFWKSKICSTGRAYNAMKTTIPKIRNVEIGARGIIEKPF